MPSPDPAASPDKVNIADKLARFSDHFQPKIVGELNGQHVKLVKFQGEFVWHSHEAEVSLMLFEPAGTVNTGTAGGAMTVAEPERI